MAGDEPHKSKHAKIIQANRFAASKVSEAEVARVELQAFKDRAEIAIREARLFEMVLTIVARRTGLLSISKAELQAHRPGHGFRMEVSKTDGAIYLHYEDMNEQPAADERVGEGVGVDAGQDQPAVPGGSGAGGGS